MSDDRGAVARAGGGAKTPAVARLLEAERQADDIVRRAREEAEAIIEKAKERAGQVSAGVSQAPAQEGHTSRLQEALERQKRLIMDEGQRRIESMRVTASARLHEAVEKLLAVLIGEP